MRGAGRSGWDGAYAEEGGGRGRGFRLRRAGAGGASAGPCTQVCLREEKPALRSTVFSFIRLLSTEKQQPRI